MGRVLAALVLLGIVCQACAQGVRIAPEPKQMQALPGRFAWAAGLSVGVGSPERDLEFARQLDRESRRCFGVGLTTGDPFISPLRLGVLSDATLGPALAGLDLSPLDGKGPDAYVLMITPQGITLAGKGPAGVLNALLTLAQVMRQAAPDATLPCLQVMDWPTPHARRTPPPAAAPQSPTPTPPAPVRPPADQRWKYLFSAADHARFAGLLAGLRAEGEEFMLHPPAGAGPADFLRYTVLSKAPPGGRMRHDRNATIYPSWGAGVTICKFPTDAEAALRWKSSVIVSGILDYRRDDLDARRQGLEAQGLGGTIQVTEDSIVDWYPSYLPWYYGGPVRNPDSRYKYWVEYGLKIVCLYKNCIIEAGASRVEQFQGGDRPGRELLPADPAQILAAARALVDEKRGERAAVPPPIPAAPPVVAPEQPDEGGEGDAAYLDRRWLGSVVDALAQAERRMAQTRGLLAIQRAAAAQLREGIQRLELLLTVDAGETDDPLEWFATHWDAAWGQAPPVPAGQGVQDGLRQQIAGLREQLAGVLQEQDAAIAAMRDTYAAALEELQAVGARCATPSVRQAGEALRAQVTARMEMAELELSFASGQREKFRSLARGYLAAGRQVPLVRLMEGLDDIEHDQPRGALEAMKLCLAADPGNAVATELEKRLEVGYLRAIDANVTGEAAEVREACWDRLKRKGEDGFFGALFDILGTGPANAINETWNDESLARAEEAGTLQMDAATTHGGLLLIARLRERNLSLPAIRALSNPEFIGRVKGLFGREISARDALRMRAAMMAAFRSPDLVALTGGRAQLSVDTGQPATASGAFEETWGEWIGDCVNIKNVVTMVGPSAVYTQGGKVAGLSLAAEGELVTAKDAFAGALRLPQLAQATSQSRYGQLCAQKLLQFYEGTGTLSHLLAEGLVQMGIVQAASSVGQLVAGDTGDRIATLAADLITSYGVGDVDLAVKLLRENGATPHHVRCIAARMREAAARLETPDGLTQQRARFDSALKRLEAGQPLAPADLKELEDSARLLAQMRKALAESAASRPSMALTQRQQTVAALADGVEQVRKGEVAGAQVSRSFVEACGDIELNGRRTCDQLAQDCDQIAQRLGEGGAPAASVPAAGGAARSAGIRGLNAPAPQSPLDAGKGHDRLRKLDLVAPEGCTPVPDRHFRQGDYERAARYYEGLAEHVRNLEGAEPGWQANALEYLTERRDLARRARAAQQAFDAAGGAANANATTAISQAEIAELTARPDLKLAPIEGPGTLTRPQWVTLGGRRVGVFKPLETGAAAGAAEAQVEAAFGAVGELLGIKVPASAPVTMKLNGVDTPGVFIRYVDGSELGACDVGQVLAVREQIARARVLRTFLGDYDLQARNLRVGADGTLFDLDHGQARIMGPDMGGPTAPEDLRAVLLRHMEMCATSDQHPAAAGNPLYQLVGAAERQVEYAEVQGVIEQIRTAMQRGDIRRSLAPVFGADIDKVMQVLQVRADLLEQVFMNGKYRVIAPRLPAPVGWWPMSLEALERAA